MKIDNQIGKLPIIVALCLLGSCSAPLTKSLFQQSGRAHIYLPTSKEEKAAILGEQVTFKTTVDTIRPTKPEAEEDAKGERKTIRLEELTVTAQRPKVKISTIRNGKVRLTFFATLPKAFMDDKWQVVLSPKLINGEEVRALPPMVLQGAKFKAEQDKAYERFEAFEKGIIGKDGYDSVFFDKKKHNDFITKLQRSYYRSYMSDYRLQKRYDRWRKTMEARHLFFNAKMEGSYNSKVSQAGIEMLTKAYDAHLYGEDSSKMHRDFAEKYNDSIRAQYLSKHARQIEEWQVPYSYKTLYRYNLTMDSLRNSSVTERDSIEVARFTYDEKKIAHNESKRDNKDVYRRHIIGMERIQDPAYLAPIEAGKDFVYMYEQDVEVTPDLQRKVQVVMDTRVTALDRSSWSQSGLDSIAFIISGLNDLVDRPLMDRLPEAEQAQYKAGLDRLAVRDYQGALEILRQWPDYNSALSLAAMGYNDQAYKLLDMLGATAKVDYLKAIVLVRSKQYDLAKTYLLSAARKDVQLAYKVDIEPEFVPLLEQDPKLSQEIEAIIGDIEDL